MRFIDNLCRRVDINVIWFADLKQTTFVNPFLEHAGDCVFQNWSVSRIFKKHLTIFDLNHE